LTHLSCYLMVHTSIHLTGGTCITILLLLEKAEKNCAIH